MKNIKKILASAALFAVIGSSTAFAEMPSFTVVKGSNAYSLEYLNNNVSQEEYKALGVQDGKVFVKTSEGKWIDNSTGEVVDKNNISEVIYKDETGKKLRYAKGDGDEIKDDSLKDTLYILKINKDKNNIGQAVSFNMTNCAYDEIVPNKFVIYNEQNKAISKEEYVGKASSYIYPCLKEGEKITIKLFDCDDKEFMTLQNIKVSLNKDIEITKDNFKPAETIKIKNAKELIENIGSNRILVLEPGDYNLLEAEGKVNNKYAYYEDVFDGKELIIDGVSNLTIKGDDKGKTQLLVNPRYANVITFRGARSLNIENATIGHTKGKGYCTGGVLKFTGGQNININNSILFGCGTQGIDMLGVIGFNFNNSTIKECSYGIMTLASSSNIKFNESKFFDNEEYFMINIDDCNSVEFNKCDIYNNKISGDYGTTLFELQNSNEIIVKNCNIKNNKFKEITNYKDAVKLENTKLQNNK